MIDAHCHLDTCADPTAVDAGLSAIVSVGTDPESCRSDPHTRRAVHSTSGLCMGVHPNSADDATPEARNEIERLAENERVVGVGETGF